MNAESQAHAGPSIKGHVIALNDGQSVAVYERNGEWYVVEFREGHGELNRAGAWFHSNAERLRHCCNGRAASQSYASLSPEVVEKIERIHAERKARQEAMRDLRRKVATTVKRCLLGLIAWRRGSMSEIS